MSALVQQIGFHTDRAPEVAEELRCHMSCHVVDFFEVTTSLLTSTEVVMTETLIQDKSFKLMAAQRNTWGDLLRHMLTVEEDMVRERATRRSDCSYLLIVTQFCIKQVEGWHSQLRP